MARNCGELLCQVPPGSPADRQAQQTRDPQGSVLSFGHCLAPRGVRLGSIRQRNNCSARGSGGHPEPYSGLGHTGGLFRNVRRMRRKKISAENITKISAEKSQLSPNAAI